MADKKAILRQEWRVRFNSTRKPDCHCLKKLALRDREICFSLVNYHLDTTEAAVDIGYGHCVELHTRMKPISETISCF